MNDKILLITGGTGSFGNALLTKYLEHFKEIRILSRDEKKQDDMRKKFSSTKIKFYIGDVRDKLSIDSAISGCDYIFHSAALKQVPSCEFFPMEAVKTNIIGTDNVLSSALNYDVEKVVVLSTDKAAYPINAMGMSKALMEKVMIAKSRNCQKNSVFCGTRYGNVMASRGSVIPLFINQIKSKKNLTITDPLMTRFMMTLDDAVELVIYAFQNADSGDIFVQKSPAATIEVLAEALLDLYNSSSKIDIIGSRHGEKIYETLVNREDMSKAVELENYYKIPSDKRDLNYEKYFSKGNNLISDFNEYNSHNTYRLNIDEMKKLLLKLPEIRNDLSLNG